MLGFANYYSMMLELDELDERELFALLDELERGHAAAVRARTSASSTSGSPPRFGVDARGAAALALRRPVLPGGAGRRGRPRPVVPRPVARGADARASSRAIGFDIRDLLARADLYEKPGKSQHAFCLSVDRGGRHPRAVQRAARTSTGWAPCSTSSGTRSTTSQIDRDAAVPAARAGAHLTTEAIGDAVRPAVQERGVARDATPACPETRRGAAATALARAPRGQLLVQTRWSLVMCHMERALYRDPGAGPRHAVVGPGRALPVGAPPGGPRRAGLGEQDPLQRGAGLLPQLHARRDDGLAARRPPPRRRARRRRRRRGSATCGSPRSAAFLARAPLRDRASPWTGGAAIEQATGRPLDPAPSSPSSRARSSSLSRPSKPGLVFCPDTPSRAAASRGQSPGHGRPSHVLTSWPCRRLP